VKLARVGCVGAGWLLASCGGQRTITAPPPEYERPVVRPWDAGAEEEPEDPFAAASEGDWIEDPVEEVDAGSPPDGGTAADAEAATPADAAVDAGPEAARAPESFGADASVVDAGGNP